MASTSKGLMLKVGLLSISITMGTQMAIAPALPEIMKSFPEKTTTQVETLTTVQSITALVFVLLCPLVASYLSKKRTVMLGLLVAGISGIVPLLCGALSAAGMDNILVFRIVWLSRLVYGGGVGLVCGLAVSMIGDFFEGDERAMLLGVRTSMETLGQVATTALAGVLLGLGWQWPFAVYAILFVLLVLFTIGVPADEPTAGKKAASDGPAEPQIVPATVLVLCALNFLFMTCYSGINVRIPSIMTEGGFGTSSQSSVVISALAICGLVSGLIFGKVFGVLRGKTPALGAGLLALGCFLAGVANSMPMIFAAGISCGFAYPLFISYMMNHVTDIAPKSSVMLCTSVAISSGFLAGFFSPYILSWVGRVVGEAAAAPFIPFACLMAGIAVLCFFLYGGEK
ncbi:MAG: MFS transporter [Atopobiaceae bacterium]|nr:MFS transporter [Atopobiaceae bacterium]